MKCINEKERVGFNKLKKLKIITICFLTISCGTTKKYYKDDFKILDHKLEGEFFNSQSNNFVSNSSERKITDLFGIKTNDSIVKIKTVGDNLILSYTNGIGKLKHHSYPGDFKNKHFELYLNYETKTIPVLLVTKRMDYLRFSVLKDGSLVINYQHVNEGMLLLFGAGQSYSDELIYKSKI